MSNLATIVNNILADSGIDDLNVVVTTGSYSNPTWINSLDWSKITSTPTTLSGYGITDAVPSNRTLTINGTAFDLSANRSWSVGTVTSVGLSMPSAFSVTNTPVTTSGTLTVTAAGLATQYIRGDGQLANFPTTSGGGTAVSYYMNGSVNQGTFGGNTYYEFSKTAVVGGGTNFTAAVNGYIAQFITDPNDPDLLNIPAGNWEVYTFLGASTNSGSPSYYVELYKYDTGGTFTLIADTSSTPTLITGGTNVDLYITAIPVPSTSLNATDRLAIRVYVNPSGNTITLYTEGTRLAQVGTTFSTGLTALNGLTDQVQYFATGTSGTDFSISSVTDTHTFNLPTASATNRGALSATDWTTFNNKIGGSLVSGYIPKATGTNTVDSSELFQSAGLIGIGTTSPTQKLDVRGRIAINTSGQSFTINNFYPSGGQGNNIFIGNGGQNGVYFSGFNAAWNTSLGINAFLSSTTGFQNTAIGYRSLETSTTGNNNVAVGASSMLATTSGTQNVAVGTMALGTNTTGQNNTAVGQEAGIYRVGGSNETSNNSIYLGYYTRASASGNNNEIVIGSQTDGNGSNSVTLGNSSITNTYLRGNINLNTVNAAVIDTDRFLVSDSGVVKYRTGAEVLSDIGAAASTSISGTTNYIPKFTSSSAIGNSIMQEIGSTIFVGGNANIANANELQWKDSGGNSQNVLYMFSDNNVYLSSPVASSNLIFRGVGYAERMRLDAFGNLGVGTSVNSGARINAFISEVGATPNAILRLQNSGNSYLARMILTDGVTNDGVIGYQGGSTSATQYLGFGLGVNATQMILTAAGNVGIGTTSPNTKLQVTSNSSAGTVAGSASIVLSNRDNTNSTFVAGGIFADMYRDVSNPAYGAGIWFERVPVISNASSDANIIFGSQLNPTSGLPTERMRIAAGGNVGIGTTSPAARLDVRVPVEIPATGAVALIAGTSNGANDIFRWFDGTTQLGVFKNNGNVGIGTTNPSTILHIENGTEANLRIVSGGVGGDQGSIYIQKSTGGGLTFAVENRDFIFRTGLAALTGGGGNERMRITSGGDVGIGTSNPIQPLTVAAASNANTIALLGRSSDNAQRIDFYNNAGNTRLFTLATGNSQTELYNDANIPMIFSTNAAERMRITSGGNVLIASSVDSGLAKLQVTGSIQQTSVTSSLVKTDGNGVLVAATAGTDYLTATNSNFTYNASVTLSTSWQDTGVDNTNLTTSGVYIVTCYVDDFGVSGGQYQVTYTGIMYWFATGTNDTNVSEIALHHMGHADNNRYIYLRTRTTPSAAGTYLQIKGNGTNSGASTYIFTFKRLL